MFNGKQSTCIEVVFEYKYARWKKHLFLHALMMIFFNRNTSAYFQIKKTFIFLWFFFSIKLTMSKSQFSFQGFWVSSCKVRTSRNVVVLETMLLTTSSNNQASPWTVNPTFPFKPTFLPNQPPSHQESVTFHTYNPNLEGKHTFVVSGFTRRQK